MKCEKYEAFQAEIVINYNKRDFSVRWKTECMWHIEKIKEKSRLENYYSG